MKFINLVKLCAALSISADEMVQVAKQCLPDTEQTAHLACEPDSSAMRDGYREAAEQSRRDWTIGPFTPELVNAACSLSDDGQHLVATQLRIAIDTAVQMYGTRAKQTAA